jgi:hypothetical protein
MTEMDTPQLLKLRLRGENASGPSAEAGKNLLPGPLKYTGSLDHFPHFEVTPSIGREFGKEMQLTDLLNAPNSDDLIRDLGVLSEWTRFVLLS